MLYLFSGDDSKNKIAAYEKFIKSMPIGMETFFISRNNFDQMQIESLYSGAGLFFSKCAVLLSDVFEREETGNFILEKIELLAGSDNFFIFVENKLNKTILDAFKNAGATISVFDKPKEKKDRFNTFSIANAFEHKDKLNMWVCFREAIRADVSLEEIVGVIFWKAKDLILKKNFGKFSEKQLKGFAAELSYLLPKARQEGNDAEASLEAFILEAF